MCAKAYVDTYIGRSVPDVPSTGGGVFLATVAVFYVAPCKCCLDVLPGCVAWMCCLDVLPGCVAWMCCLDVLPGCVAWMCLLEPFTDVTDEI